MTVSAPGLATTSAHEPPARQARRPSVDPAIGAASIAPADWLLMGNTAKGAFPDFTDHVTRVRVIARLQEHHGNDFVQRLIGNVRGTSNPSWIAPVAGQAPSVAAGNSMDVVLQRDEDDEQTASGDSFLESDGDTVSDAVEGLLSDAGQLVDSATEAVGDAASDVTDLAEGVVDQATGLISDLTGEGESESDPSEAPEGVPGGSALATLTLTADGPACTPFPTQKEAIDARDTLATILLPLLTSIVGGVVAPLWKQYLFGGSDPQELTDPGIVGPFASSGTSIKAGSDAADSILLKMDTFRDSQLPDGTHRIEQDSVINPDRRKQIENAMDYDIPGTVPGNIAGGIGKDQQSARIGAKPSPFNDSRRLGGTIDISTLPDGRRAVVVHPVFTIFDTIDLCPGDPGSPFERLFTIPMSRCEASGVSGDVPFRVAFGTGDELRIAKSPTKPPSSREPDPPLPPSTG